MSLTLANRKLQLWCASACVALVSFVVAHQTPALNREIFERLMIAFGGEQIQPQLAQLPTMPFNWAGVSGILNVIGFAVFSTGETFLAFYLALLPRTLCSMILFVLSLMFQYGLWHAFRLESHPVGFVCAIAGGLAVGMLMRLRQDAEKQAETQYYGLTLKNRELLEARLSLLKQDEDERRNMAAGLNDQVMHDMKIIADRFESFVKGRDQADADVINELTNRVMREIREVMEALSPSIIEHLGLGAAIEDCLRRGADRSGFKVRFKNRLEFSDLDGLSLVEQGLLYRLAQEAVTNVCKHAEAATVRTTLEKEDDNLVIRIVDDGKGMDAASQRGESRGMKYQKYRAEQINAKIAWRNGDKGKGTTVEIRLNLGERLPQNREEG